MYPEVFVVVSVVVVVSIAVVAIVVVWGKVDGTLLPIRVNTVEDFEGVVVGSWIGAIVFAAEEAKCYWLVGKLTISI